MREISQVDLLRLADQLVMQILERKGVGMTSKILVTVVSC